MVGGLAIIDRIMARFRINILQVHNRGVRDGLILTMLDDAQESPRRPQIREIAKRPSSVLHSHVVANQSMVGMWPNSLERFFEQLVEPFQLDPADRPLLEAAARLQDVGYLINYDQHHKHSYHLILNSNLNGFNPSRVAIDR